MAKTGVNFLKDEALNCLTDLKATAAAEKYDNLPHFRAVYDALKFKMSSTRSVQEVFGSAPRR